MEKSAPLGHHDVGPFDLRVLDGDGISRFIEDVASVLEKLALLLD